MLNTKKRNMLFLAFVVLSISLLSSVIAYDPTARMYGKACDVNCAAVSYSSCGIADETGTDYGSFGSISGHSDCIYEYCGTSACSSAVTSCNFGACTLGTCMNGETFTSNVRSKDCSAPSVFIITSRYLFATVNPNSVYRSNCIDQTLTTSLLGTGLAQGVFSRGTSYSQEYTSGNTLSLVSDSRFSEIKFLPLNFNSNCDLVSFHGASPATQNLGYFDCPAGLGSCCKSSTTISINVNDIAQDSNYAYLCADSRFPFSTFTGESIPSTVGNVFYRRNIDYPFKIDKISGLASVFSGTGNRDVLATNYVGASSYGWLVCNGENFMASDFTTNVGVNVISDTVVDSVVSSSLNGQSTYSDFYDIYDSDSPGSSVSDFSTISLADLTNLIDSVRIGSASGDVVSSESSVGYYMDENYLNPDDVLVLFDDGDNYIPSDSESLSGELYLDGVLFNIDEQSEFLLSGIKFDTAKRYLRIGIRKNGESSIAFFDNSNAGFVFRKPGSSTVQTDLSFVNDVFKVQLDDYSTPVDESGLIKPIYVGYAEFSKPQNVGSNYDVVVYACPTDDFSSVSSCDYYQFKNVLSVSQVAEWRDTNLIESYFCSDSKIYECTGPTYYSMNPTFLDTSKKWSDTDYYFSRLRRTSQVVDLVYDPDYEKFSETSFDNTLLYRTSSSSLNNKKLIANSLANKFLFKRTFGDFDYLALDFFTWNSPNTDLKVCIRDDACCANVPQSDIFSRVFQNFKLSKESFEGCNNDYTINNIYVTVDTTGPVVLAPDGSYFYNVFAFDRVFLGRNSQESYFCGSDRTWHKDFDYDGWACENTAGLFWAGGLESTEDSDLIKDNNTQCCGDDSKETWEFSNGVGACYSSNFVYNGKRVLDSYRMSDVDVHDDSSNVGYSKLLALNGEFYSCNLGSNDLPSDLSLTIENSVQVGNILNLISSSNQKSSCDIAGTYYCSSHEGWKNDYAVDLMDKVYSSKRTTLSSIAEDLDVDNLNSVYLYDGTLNSKDSTIGERGIENHVKPYLDGCCPDDWCWNGYSCVENQRDEPTNWLRLVSGDNSYRCIDGTWTLSEKVETWQETASNSDPSGTGAESLIRNFNTGAGLTHGYCPRVNDCLVNPTANYNSSFDNLEQQNFLNGYVSGFMSNLPTLYNFYRFNEVQCIPNGYYVGDYYCDSGSWKSRVALMSEQLLNFTDVLDINEYTLHCGRFDFVFNTKGSIPSVQHPEEYNWKGCVLRYVSSDEVTTENPNGNRTIMALEFNNDPFSNGVIDSTDINRIGRSDLFSSGDYKMQPYSYYDSGKGILFFSKSGSLPSMPLVQSSRGVLTRLLDFFKSVFSSNSFDVDENLAEFSVYDKLYLSKSDSGNIFAVSGFNSGQQIITKVVYDEFSDNVISNISSKFDQFKQYEEDRVSDYSIKLFRSNQGSWNDFSSHDDSSFTIYYTVNDAFDPSQSKFYDDFVNSDSSFDKVLWETLVDDFALQTRLIR